MSVTEPIFVMQIANKQFVFRGEEITSATLVEEVHPISLELPISTLDFTIMFYDESFSMFGGEYFQLLTKRLPIDAWEVVDGIYLRLGRFYLTEWKNLSEREFTFKAIDALGLLDGTIFDGIFLEEARPFDQLIEELLEPTGVSYSISDDLLEIPEIVGWIEPCNYREALQQLCFAGGLTASTARRQELEFMPAEMPADYIEEVPWGEFPEITNDEKLKQTVELLPAVSRIELVVREYKKGDELEDIFIKILPVGQHKIIFRFPFSDFSFDLTSFDDAALATGTPDYVTTEDGNYIQVENQWSLYLNSLYFDLQLEGLITIKGIRWKDQPRSIVFTDEGAYEFKDKQDVAVTTVTVTNANDPNAPLTKLQDYYQLRYLQKMELIPTETKPGDLVLTSSFYDQQVFGVVTKMVTNLSGGFRSDAEVLGLKYEEEA